MSGANGFEGTIVELRAYLDRVGFEGEPRPDLATLGALSKRHLLSIPYENIDVQLGRTLTTDPAAAYARIVGQGRRGGWCYEMNGVFGLALAAIGFRVTRLASGVARSMKGDAALGNHLVLRVDTGEGPILADVGLANGPRGPYPIREGPFSIEGQDYKLERTEDGYWRFHNHPQGMAPNFDFKSEPGDDEAALARACVALQTDPQSPFVQNLVCVRFTPDGENQLRGRSLRRLRPEGTSERVLESVDDLIATLESDFGIVEPAVAALWPKICARHEAVLARAEAEAAQPAD
ncbi:MAG TPA: arylamine N-acetyltransferase [Caulobacteraceae bacterium]|nr:arylamine N-acetyltransferase [Caulobacteraceae bacterium]